MKNFTTKKLQALLRPNLRLIRRSAYVLLSLACILLLSGLLPNHQPQLASLMTGKAVAQITNSAPTGIYGGVPLSLQAVVRYAQLRHNGRVVTVPTNGIGNYVLYYAPGGTQIDDIFIPPGTYQVEYLDRVGNLVTDSAGCNRSPGVCEVTYNPITDPSDPNFYTLSLQVPNQPLNPPPNGVPPSPLGIYGVVTNAATGLPVANAVIFLEASTDVFGSGNETLGQLQTNGNGFYSFYYTGGGIKGFIPPGIYKLEISNSVINFNYNPPTGDDNGIFLPQDQRYYVLNAALEQNFSLTH